MTHTISNKKPTSNPYCGSTGSTVFLPDTEELRGNPHTGSTVFLIEIAASVAFSMFLVKTPVRFMRDSVLAKTKEFIRYAADKSVRGVYYPLRSVVNNGLTRRISPSVSLLDDKIENACSTTGRWVGHALVFPATAAFYLVTTVCLTAASIAAATLLAAMLTLHVLFTTLKMTCKALYEEAFLDTKKKAEDCEGALSKAAYIGSHMSLKFLVLGVLLPTLVLSMYALYRVVSLALTPILAPIYMLSSALGLDNRFNIYNYERGIGTVHGFILDILESRHKGSTFHPPFLQLKLVIEAVSGSSVPEDTTVMSSVRTDLQYPKLESPTQYTAHAVA